MNFDLRVKYFDLLRRILTICNNDNLLTANKVIAIKNIVEKFFEKEIINEKKENFKKG